MQLRCIYIAGAVLSDGIQLCVYVYIWSGNARQSAYTILSAHLLLSIMLLS